MSDQHRPGGLTALAVLNFVFGAVSLLSVGTPWLPLLAQLAPEMDEEARAQLEVLTNLTKDWAVFIIATGAIGGLLLLISGIGYLQQKKFLGRTLGNASAVFELGVAVSTALWLPAAVGGGFGLGTILNFLYPVVTLVLVNLTFKEDLTR